MLDEKILKQFIERAEDRYLLLDHNGLENELVFFVARPAQLLLEQIEKDKQRLAKRKWLVPLKAIGIIIGASTLFLSGVAYGFSQVTGVIPDIWLAMILMVVSAAIVTITSFWEL